jgi:hypothetical protein
MDDDVMPTTEYELNRERKELARLETLLQQACDRVTSLRWRIAAQQARVRALGEDRIRSEVMNNG